MAKLTNAELRDQIESEKAIAGQDLQKWDIRTRGGMEGRQREALRKVESLELQLRSGLITNAAIIVGTPGVDNSILLSLAEKSNSEVIEFLELEHKIVDAIYKGSLDGFRVGNEFQIKLNRILAQLASEMGAYSIPTPSIPANKYGNYNSKEEVVDLLADAFTKEFGTELKQKYMQVVLDGITNKHVKMNTENLGVIITDVPENFLTIFDGITNLLIIVSPNDKLQGIVLYTEGDSEDDIKARINAAIKTRKA